MTMDAHTSTSHQHILHPPASPQVRPPLSPSSASTTAHNRDYMPKRSVPSSPQNTTTSSFPPVRHSPTTTSRPLPFGTNASPPSYLNGNTTSIDPQSNSTMSNDPITETAPIIPRKRAHVEDILNPVHQEVIVSKPPPDTSTAKPARPAKPTNNSSTNPPTPAPKQLIPPSSGSAITISSSTVSSTKSTPTSTVPLPPIKQPKSIRLHVPLNGSSNVYINFASLAEKTYGPEIFNSKRLLGPQGFASSFLNHDRILDTGSDGSEAEDDDASEKGDDPSAVETDAGGVKKKTPIKRKRRQAGADKYDVEDPFIDDSEALMEQVAAASKDGFFVYSGPLIAEGERAKIDKYIPSRRANERVDVPKKRKAPAKKPAGEKVPRAKKVKEKGSKGTESNTEDVPPPAIAQ